MEEQKKRGPGRPKGYPKSGGGKKGAQARNVAPEVRGAFLRACKFLEDDGSSLSELILKALKEDVNGTLHAVSRFVPKELLLEGNVSHSIVDVLSKYDDAIEKEQDAKPQLGEYH